jgi:predicted phage terminase large subunit-like protein
MRIVKPQEKQEKFLANPADIVIYGGAAGGGKTWALLAEPLRHVNNRKFRCTIFRRTYTQVVLAGGLWDESKEIYPAIRGAVPVKGNLQWRFPSGSVISFGHLQYSDTVFDYQGAQIALICFDELTHFSEDMFFYMLSRNRSVSGVKPYVRATCNADADSWVAKFIEWWIDPQTGFAIEERAGVVRWFIRLRGVIHWRDSQEEIAQFCAEQGVDLMPKSVSFIPAKVYDNPILLESDPTYLANLMALPLVDMERLLNGNWKIKAEAGKIFNRSWFDIVDQAPQGGLEVLYWDFAATEKKMGTEGNKKANDPDFTAGVSIKYHSGVYYITGMWAEQLSPTASEELYQQVSTAFVNRVKMEGGIPLVRFELETGSAARRDAIRLIKMLPFADVRGIPSEKDKITRAKALASQARVRNVKLVKGAWNEEYLTHMHHQPDLAHDDIMDGSSGSYNAIQTHLAENVIQANSSVSLSTF